MKTVASKATCTCSVLQFELKRGLSSVIITQWNVTSKLLFYTNRKLHLGFASGQGNLIHFVQCLWRAEYEYLSEVFSPSSGCSNTTRSYQPFKLTWTTNAGAFQQKLWFLILGTSTFKQKATLPSSGVPDRLKWCFSMKRNSNYYIDKSVLLENTSLVKFIRNYIRDPSGIIFHISLVRILMTLCPAFSWLFVQTVSEKCQAIDLSI